MRVIRHFLAVICVMAILTASGCGGGSEDSSSAPAPSTPPTTPSTPPSTPQGPAAGEDNAGKDGESAEGSEDGERETPEDLSQWIEEDFIKARQEQDPRLLEAVPTLAQAAADGQRDAGEAVGILAALIEPLPEPEPQQGSGSPGDGSSYESGSPYESGSSYGSPPGSSYGPSGPSGSPPGSGYTPSGPPSSYPPSYPPSGPSPSNPSAQRSGSRGSRDPQFERKLLEAAVGGVVTIGNQAAQEVIHNILAAEIEGIDDRTATETAIRGIVDEWTPSYKKLVMQLLTKPESFREVGEAQQRSGSGTPYGPSSPPSSYGSGSPPSSYGSGSPPSSYGSGSPPSSYEGYGEYTSSPPEYSGSPSYGSGSPYGNRRNAQPMTAAEIQELTFELVRSKADEEMRQQLLVHLLNPSIPASHRNLLGPFLLAPDPKNLPIHLALLQQASGDDPLVGRVLRYITEFSSAAFVAIMGARQDAAASTAMAAGGAGQGQAGEGGGTSLSSLLGAEGNQPRGSGSGSGSYPGSSYPGSSYPGGSMPPDSGQAAYEQYSSEGYPGSSSYPGSSGYPGSSSPYGSSGQRRSQQREVEIEAIPRDLAFQLAPRIWGSQAVDVVSSRLNRVSSLEAGAQDILLAGTYPMDSVREKLLAVLRAHWDEGPQSLIDEGMGNGLALEPGFLVCIKKLPREDPQPEAQGRAAQRGYGGRPQPGARGGRPPSPSYPPSTPPQSGEGYGSSGPRGERVSDVPPKVQWQQAIRGVIRELCKTCKDAADYHALHTPQAVDQFAGSRSFSLHPDAWVTAEYRLNWPNSEIRERLSGVTLDPMVVHYVRVEEKARPIGVFGFYRRQFRTADVHAVESGGWLEQFKFIRDGAPRMQSIDVVLTFQEQPTTPQDEIDFVLEILCIEVRSPDPADTAQRDQQAAAR